MDWKRYFNEVIANVGTVSIIFLLIQLIWRLFGDFEITLLGTYIVLAVFTFLTYHLFPKLIKNFRGRRKLFYTVVVIEITVLYTLNDIIFSLINLQEKRVLRILITIPVLFAALSVVYVIVYFVQSVHYKRINKKLDEYKRQNDDDNAEK